jgi:zinc protease
MVLAVVGDVDPARVIVEAERLFSDRPSRVVELPAPAADPVPLDGPKQVFHGLDKRQAHVVYGFPGTTVTSPDRFGLELLATVLGGQSGRLFIELRDKKGLAYRVSASTVDGIDPGYFAVYLATSPENVAVAVAGIEDELERLRQTPIPKEELERARRYLIGAHDISLQRRSSLASTIAFHVAYGLGPEAHHEYAAALGRVTPADLQRLAARYLDRRRAVISTVRPEERSPVLAKKQARQGPNGERPVEKKKKKKKKRE